MALESRCSQYKALIEQIWLHNKWISDQYYTMCCINTTGQSDFSMLGNKAIAGSSAELFPV